MAEIEREVRIDASPETVFELLTDAEQMKRWMGMDGELDPRPGGIFRLRVTPTATAVGEFREVDPPKRVVYTFGWEEPGSIAPGSTTVEFTLQPDGDGTLLRMVHAGLPDAEAVALHAEGWEHYLGRLEVVGGGGDAGVDPWTQGGDR